MPATGLLEQLLLHESQGNLVTAHGSNETQAHVHQKRQWPRVQQQEAASVAFESGNRIALSKPGSPWQNGYVESLNASLGIELLDREIFEPMEHLQKRLDQ